jgi:hypothetical protein
MHGTLREISFTIFLCWGFNSVDWHKRLYDCHLLTNRNWPSALEGAAVGPSHRIENEKEKTYAVKK